MRNRVLKNIYFRIYISKYFARLQSLNELYSDGNKEEYLRKMEVFYSDLLRFPQIYYKNAPIVQSNNELIRSFSAMPDDPLNSVYSGHIELFLKIEQLIHNRNANELNNLSENLRLFLDKLYNTVTFNKRTSKRIKYPVAVGGIIALAFLFAILYSPLKEKYDREKRDYDLAANEEAYKQKTVNDILALKEALEKYHNDNKSYPKSSGGWDGILSYYGESKKDWIPGLAPKYIKELPVDPRKSKIPIEQYWYKSNGTDFKLIAHYPLGMPEVINTHPELVDSIRPSWAFGVWSKDAKSW